MLFRTMLTRQVSVINDKLILSQRTRSMPYSDNITKNKVMKISYYPIFQQIHNIDVKVILHQIKMFL